MKTLTVFTPSYNRAYTLPRLYKSLCEQTCSDFCWLVVDDGSTDDSVEIVQSYHDSRIRLIKNKHDYIGSLNILLDEARGKYIARMDADDVMMPERLKIQFEYMR